MLSQDTWDPNFSQQYPYFKFLHKTYSDCYRSLERWPNLEEYNQWANFFQAGLSSPTFKTFVEQQPKTIHQEDFFQGYEQRIYLEGHVQTRTQNWHDFFNMLCWFSWPKTKRTMNRFQFLEQAQRRHLNIGQRTRLENKLTHFDEFGLVVVSSDKQLLQHLKQHEWQQLFYQDPERCLKHLKLFIVGHAIYERLLNPFLGLTAKCLLLPVSEDFFQHSTQYQQQLVDTWADVTIQDKVFNLHPLPILGYPGWYANQDKAFYLNTQYFRPKKQVKHLDEATYEHAST